MKKREVMARLFALSLSATMIGGNTLSAVAAGPDNGAEKVVEQKNATRAAAEFKANVVVDSNKGTVEGETNITLKGNALAFSTEYTGKLPKVTAKEGFTFKGWKLEKVDGTGTYEAKIQGEEIVVTIGMLEVGAKGNFKITAEFEGKDIAAHMVVDLDKGFFADGSNVSRKTINTKAGKKMTLPEVTAKDGWKFTGWLNGETQVAGATDTELDVTPYATFMPNDAFANLTAAFEAVEAVKATFTVDPLKGYFPEEGTATSIDKVLTGNERKVDFPEVKGNDNFDFNGWSVKEANGTVVTDLPATATSYTFDKVGEYTIEALFTEKAPVDKTANAVFKIANKDAATFTGIGLETSYGHIEENNYKITVLPELTINPGYELKGWEVVDDATGQVIATYSKDAKEIDVKNPGNYTINVLFEEQERINAYFTVGDTNKGHIKDSAVNQVVFEGLTNKLAGITIPRVEAENGWKFVGWSFGGKDVVIRENQMSCTFEELKNWATFTEGSKLGIVSFEAVFEEVTPEVEEKTVNVYFSLNKDQGVFVDNPEAETDTYKNVTDEKINLPEVKAKDGYVFKGWKGYGKEEIILDAEATELGGLKEIANFAEGSTNGDISLTAVFEKAPEVEKTVNVYFSLNKDQGVFVNNPEAETDTYKNVTDEKINLPEVKAKDGYVFKGWKGYGKEEIILDAEATELGGLKEIANFAEGSTNGDISLTAVFEKAPEVEKTVNVYFSLNKDQGVFVNNPEAETDTYKNITEDKLAIPEVKAKDGYVFKGWKGYGKDEIILDAGTTELGGLKDLANFAEGSNNGDISLTAVFEKAPEVEKTVNVYFSLNKDQGVFVNNPEAETDTYKNITEDKLAIPEVKAKDGYVFKGWKGYGKEEIILDAEATELGGLKDLANFAEGSTNGDISLTAVFEKAPEVEKTVNVYFSLNKDQGVFVNNPEAETDTYKNITEDKLAIPEVKAKDGYVFKGWKGYGKEEIILDAEATELGGLKDLANFAEGSNNGDISLEAQFEKAPVAEEKTVNVYFNVDANKGYFTDPEGAEVVSFENIAADSADQFNIPKVAAKEGYVFKGWKGQGAETIEWGADAETFGVTGLAHFPEGSNVGYVTLEAVFEEVPEVEEEKIVNVYFNVDPEKGYFTDPEGAEVVSFENIAADSADQFLVPKVAAKEGYVFKGWKGQGAEEINWDANATTFGVTGLAHFAEGSNVGYATIEAVFEKAPVAEEKTVNVYFNVDPEKGYFTDPEGAEVVSFENIAADSAQQFLVPKVAAKEGYVFKGWKGQGADVIEWDANATTFGVTGLAHFAEGSNVGYATIEAVFEKEAEAPEVLEKASADIVIDLEKGYFTDWGKDVAVLENDNLQESDYTLGFLPKVTTEEGYKFTGWKVTNKAGEVVYELDTNATSIVFPYGVGDEYTVEAVLAKEAPVDPEKPVDPDKKPEEDKKPETDKKPEADKKPEKDKDSEGVKTGDTAAPGALAVAALGSLAAILALVFKRK